MKFNGQALRAARESKGFSQEQLGVAAGSAAATISRLENGVRPPTLETVSKLADALGVPVSQLLEENGAAA
jgi:transcriptional regulator with XRE-family HTH domain